MKLFAAKGSRARGSAEAGIVVLVGALVAGALAGNGVAPSLMSTSDGFTWLGDDKRGEAVQINPATGQQETRLTVAPPGHQLVVAQREGLLVVTDLSSGTVTVIDVGSLVTGGRWFGTGNGAIKVLLGANQLYVVDRAKGSVQRLDPASARAVGPAWTGGGLLVDAALDGTGKVYALRGDGHLFTLTWSPETNVLAETAERTVAGAGVRTVLVSHDAGVTVFAPESGVAAQVGTGNDGLAEVGQVRGAVAAAAEAPADLVPVSVTESATVLLFHRGQAIKVNVGRLGCHRPGEPVVYHGRVYVVCTGESRVIVLNKDGGHIPPDITVPAGAAKLVKDDGKLFIHVVGADTGLVISPNGTVSTTETHDDSQPPGDPDRPKPISVPSSRPPAQEQPNRGGGAGQPSPTGAPATSGPAAPPSQAPPPPPPPAGPKTPGMPGGISITAQYEYLTTLRVKVDWAAPADNGNPINGFAVTLSTDRGYSQAFDIAALTTGAVEVPCGSRCHGMRVNASVQAVNGEGRGPAGQSGYTHNAPGQSPATGDPVVTQVAWYQSGTGFRVTMTVAPPFAWRTFTGTCTLNYSGAATGSVAVPCGKATDTFATAFTLASPGAYQFWMQAATVRSAQVAETLVREPREPPTCPRCQIP